MCEPAATVYEEMLRRGRQLRGDLLSRIEALQPGVAERVSLLAADNLLSGALRSLKRARESSSPQSEDPS